MVGHAGHMSHWGGVTWGLLAFFALLAVVATGVGLRRLLGRPAGVGTRVLPVIAMILAIAGLAGAVAVVATGPGSGGGLMRHMKGGDMGAMMRGGQTGRSASPPAVGAPDVRIAGREFSFTPSRVTVAANRTVNIVFENQGHMFHTLTVGGTRFELRANGGDTISGAFRMAAGTYTFICAVPGHADLGMRGTILAR